MSEMEAGVHEIEHEIYPRVVLGLLDGIDRGEARAMKVLVIGSGAREHALAWALAGGDEPAQGVLRPGQRGDRGSRQEHPAQGRGPSRGPAAVRELEIGLVVVGPEGPLAAGVVDALQEAGVKVFGPPRAAAMLECSKAFARSFQERRGDSLRPHGALLRLRRPEELP